MTPPYEPVVLALDGGLQEHADPRERRQALHPEIHRVGAAAGRVGRGARGGEAARQRRAAGDRRRPLARTANGMKLLVELAELLQASVVDQGGRKNFPNTHHLRRAAPR